jgi:heat shock protein HslJ
MNKLIISGFAFLLTTILLLSLLSCQRNNQDILTGTTWALIELNGEKPIESTILTIEFEMGQISGNAGCNLYGGNYMIEGEKINFDSIYNTEMACQTHEGVMDQEQQYLEILRMADRFSLDENELIIYDSIGGSLLFEPYDPESDKTVIGDENNTVQVQVPTITEDAKPLEDSSTWAYHSYRDQETGITIFIPETWIVTGIIEGDYAILQSYPEDKYIGGEPFESGDTKCDLNIRPAGSRLDELIEQWKSSSMTTILSEVPFALADGGEGIRFEIENMGKSIAVAAELNGRVVVLTCFGEFEIVDEIAATLHIEE